MIKIPHSLIVFSALLILVLPLILFITLWLNFFWCLTLGALLSYCLFGLIPIIKNTFHESLHIKALPLISGLVLILAWVLYGGIGKFGYQNFDYVKHNSIFFDLMNSKWPVNISDQQESYYLVYYLAYYLFPALIGKITSSIFLLEIASVVQAFFAISIIWLLTIIATNFRYPLLIFIGLIFWGGLDLLGNTVFFQEYSHDFGEFPEWWAGASNFQYTGFTDLLYWVPQHALGGWLTTLLCFIFLQKKLFRLLPFWVALSLLWSPFVTLGLVPFLLISLWQQGNLKLKVEWCFSRYGNFALFLAVLLFCYYSTSDFEQPFKWQWLKMGPDEFIPRYLTFLLLEISLPLLFIYTNYKVLKPELRWYLLAITLGLVFIPHIYLGVYSDFAMRASIPMLFSLFLITFLSLENNFNKKRIIAISLYLLLTSYSAISDFYRAQKLKHIELGYGPTKSFDPKGISKQYLGRQSSIFYKIFF